MIAYSTFFFPFCRKLLPDRFVSMMSSFNWLLILCLLEVLRTVDMELITESKFQPLTEFMWNLSKHFFSPLLDFCFDCFFKLLAQLPLFEANHDSVFCCFYSWSIEVVTCQFSTMIPVKKQLLFLGTPMIHSLIRNLFLFVTLGWSEKNWATADTHPTLEEMLQLFVCWWNFLIYHLRQDGWNMLWFLALGWALLWPYR